MGQNYHLCTGVQKISFHRTDRNKMSFRNKATKHLNTCAHAVKNRIYVPLFSSSKWYLYMVACAPSSIARHYNFCEVV